MTLSDLEKYRANCELLECIDRQLGKKRRLSELKAQIAESRNIDLAYIAGIRVMEV